MYFVVAFHILKVKSLSFLRWKMGHIHFLPSSRVVLCQFHEKKSWKLKWTIMIGEQPLCDFNGVCLCMNHKRCCCSVSKACPTLCNPLDYSTPGSPVLHYLPQFSQTHIHWVGDAIQPSHPLSLPSSPALNLSKHQGLFQWIGSSHQIAKILIWDKRYEN